MNKNTFNASFIGKKVLVREIEKDEDGAKRVISEIEFDDVYEALTHARSLLGSEARQLLVDGNYSFIEEVSSFDEAVGKLAKRDEIEEAIIPNLIDELSSAAGRVSRMVYLNKEIKEVVYVSRGYFGLCLSIADYCVRLLISKKEAATYSHDLMKECEECGHYYSPQRVTSSFCTGCMERLYPQKVK